MYAQIFNFDGGMYRDQEVNFDYIFTSLCNEYCIRFCSQRNSHLPVDQFMNIFKQTFGTVFCQEMMFSFLKFPQFQYRKLETKCGIVQRQKFNQPYQIAVVILGTTYILFCYGNSPSYSVNGFSVVVNDCLLL